MAAFSDAEWEQFVREYRRPLVGYFCAVVPCSAVEAEDLVQETWQSVLQRYDRDPHQGGYDPRIAGFYTYVKHGFACYIALRERSRRARQRERSLDEVIQGEASFEPADCDRFQPERSLVELEEAQFKLSAACEALRLLFLCGGYPHQQLAFGYSKVICGRQSDRGIEGNPARVDRECGAAPLEVLAGSFFRDYAEQSGIDDPRYLERMRGCLQPLYDRLPFRVEELMELDRVSRERFRKLHRSWTARTCLRDYYTGHKRGYVSAIPDWCYKVSRRVQTCLDARPKAGEAGETDAGRQRPGACDRCKLRHLPPCENDMAKPGGTGRPAARQSPPATQSCPREVTADGAGRMEG